MNPKDGSFLDMQIMWNRLIAVTGEQAKALIRTAFSTIVRECEDISAGVFDLKGRMIAQAVTGTPGHINSMAEAVKHFLEHFPPEGMNEGDTYITNDPWMGTGHLNDFVLTTPAFHNGKLVAFFACTSHLMDVGGLGVSPESSDVFMEGLYIPMLKLIDRGQVNETLMAMIKANSRIPIETEGDVYSLVASNEVGASALIRMMDEFGIDDIEPLAEYVFARSRQAVLRKIADLPKGSWSCRMNTDGYDEPIQLAATLTISDSAIHVDYEGTSRSVNKGINVPLAYTKAYSVFALACVVGGDIPNNAGSLEPFTVSAPQNSVVNAQKPLPVAARHVIGLFLPDVVFGCLRQAVPDRVPAEGASCIWNVTVRGRYRTNRSDQTPYTISITMNGGTGARLNKDGLSATAFPTGVHGTPVEIAEMQAPLVFWRKELRQGSGGDGRTRGGLGQIVEISSRDGMPFELLAAFDRIKFPARGQFGGKDGAPGYVGLSTGESVDGKGVTTIMPDQRLVLKMPGGGGLGDPANRDARRREFDQGNELV